VLTFRKKQKSKRLVIIGGSTCLLEIIELIADINAQEKRYEVIGALDDNAALHGQVIEGVRVLGGLSLAAKMDADIVFVFGIASYMNRLKRIEIFKSIGLPRERFVNLIHPSAKVYSSSTIGTGCLLYNGSVIMACCRVGDFVMISMNSVLAPYVRIDDFAILAPLVFLGSNSRVGSGAFLGSSSAIMEKTRIGPGAMIGISSAVLRDVVPGATMIGNPARLIETVEVPPSLIDAWKKPTP
jgi:sugar O-acyltransferase (sialic acid O-acetyltransferase NeuD family)